MNIEMSGEIANSYFVLCSFGANGKWTSLYLFKLRPDTDFLILALIRKRIELAFQKGMNYFLIPNSSDA